MSDHETFATRWNRRKLEAKRPMAPVDQPAGLSDAAAAQTWQRDPDADWDQHEQYQQERLRERHHSARIIASQAGIVIPCRAELKDDRPSWLISRSGL